jgi:hypothetical protein
MDIDAFVFVQTWDYICKSNDAVYESYSAVEAAEGAYRSKRRKRLTVSSHSALLLKALIEILKRGRFS